MSEARIVAGAAEAEDRLDSGLRPRKLDDFVGQRAVRENLRVFIAAASERGEALDHVLFYGPPGLGKTTLAQIVARELGVGIRATSGPVIARAGDLAAILTNLNERDVLFIDEIHRLNPAVEEILYPAMEDSQLDLIIGEGPGARSVRIDLPPFTLVGATTRTGLITTPLRERFGIPLRLDFYEVDELVEIVTRNAGLLDVALSADGAAEIAARSRGTPRIAGRLLRRRARLRGGRERGNHRRRHRGSRAQPAGGRPARPRFHGPALPRLHRGELRRRPGGDRDHRGGALRTARRAGGGDRALPDPAGLRAADAARPDAHPARLRPSGSGASRTTPAASARPIGRRPWQRG